MVSSSPNGKYEGSAQLIRSVSRCESLDAQHTRSISSTHRTRLIDTNEKARILRRGPGRRTFPECGVPASHARRGPTHTMGDLTSLYGGFVVKKRFLLQLVVALVVLLALALSAPADPIPPIP